MPFLLMLLCAFCCALPASAAPAKSQRPNILFVFADDMGRYASHYQKVDGPGSVNDVIKTPNIDRVAREGVLFRNAHVNAPSCTPCRSSLLSGQYFWRTGRAAILLGAVWNPEIPSYPLLLRDAGYHIGKSYKVWGPGMPNDAPYGGQKYAFQKAGNRFNKFSAEASKLVASGKRFEEAKAEILAEVARNFDEFLAARREGQPFCYWFGPTNTHRMWLKGSGKALWGIDPDQLQGKLPAFLPDVPEVREDFADYLGEVQAVDAALGIHLRKLEEIGELDNTLVVVSGDHGAPGFPHGKCDLYDFGTQVTLAIRGGSITGGGRVVDDFVNLPDLAPTFLEAGSVAVPDVMTGRSLMPLLKSEKSGQIDPSRAWVLTGRERHVDSAREGLVPYPHRAIRTRDHLYIINFKPDRWPMGDPVNLGADTSPSVEALTEDTFATFSDMDSSPTKAWLVLRRNQPEWRRYYDWAFAKRPREELYILADDANQLRNVAGDVKFAEIRARLETQLMDELRRTGDPRVENDGAFFESPPMAGPIPADALPPRRKKP